MAGAAVWSGTNIYTFRRKHSASVVTVECSAGRMLFEHENVSSVFKKVTKFRFLYKNYLEFT
jgi:hypothetical protein